MATLVRKKTKRNSRTNTQTLKMLVASGAPQPNRGNKPDQMESVATRATGQTSRKKSSPSFSLTNEEMMVMEELDDNKMTTPSAPEYFGEETLDSWETVMLGSPFLTPQTATKNISNLLIDGLPPMSPGPSPSAPPSLSTTIIAPLSLSASDVATQSTAASITIEVERVLSEVTNRVVNDLVDIENEKSDSMNETTELEKLDINNIEVSPQPEATMESVKTVLTTTAFKKESIYPTLPAELKIETKVSDINKEICAETETPQQEIQLQEVIWQPHFNYELSAVRQEFQTNGYEQRMKLIERDSGDLFRLLEVYLYCEHKLHVAAMMTTELKLDVQNLVKGAWGIEYLTASNATFCGDHSKVYTQLEYQSATLNTVKSKNLVAKLDELRQLRTSESNLHAFDRSLAYFRINQYISAITSKLPYRENTINMVDDFYTSLIHHQNAEQHEDIITQSVNELKYCLDVLLFFEKEITSNQRQVFGCPPTSLNRAQVVVPNSTNGDLNNYLECNGCKYQSHCDQSKHAIICSRCQSLLLVPQTAVSIQSKEWVESVECFRASLQKWLLSCAYTLHNVPIISTSAYFLTHLMHLPGLASHRSWCVPMFQFPSYDTWNDQLMDHYLTMTHLLLHPEKLKLTQIKMELSSSPELTLQQPSAMVAPWVLIDTPQVLKHIYLNDEDFVTLFHQLPNQTAYDQFFSNCTDMYKAYSRVHTLITEYVHGMEYFYEYDDFVSTISNHLAILLHIMHANNFVQLSLQSGFQLYYDSLFQIVFKCIVSAKNASAYPTLPNLPYHSINKERTLWNCFLHLYRILPEDSTSVIGDLNEWKQFCNSDRKNKYISFLLEVGEHATVFVESMSKLAIANHNANLNIDSNSLLYVIVEEIFAIGFLHTLCREQLEPICIKNLATITQMHPRTISVLLKLVYEFYDDVLHTNLMSLFQSVPIQKWAPDENDLLCLKSWVLLFQEYDIRHEVGRYFLNQMAWGYNPITKSLYIEAKLHRQVALMIVEAFLLYREETTNVVSKLRQLVSSLAKFEDWCWQLLLRLQFFNIYDNYKPFIKLIKLKSDLCLESSLLRRFYPHFDHCDIEFGEVSSENVASKNTNINHVASTLHNEDSEEWQLDDMNIEAVIPESSLVEPMVCYLICQITTHLQSNRLSKWQLLMSLLFQKKFKPTLCVLECWSVYWNRFRQRSNEFVDAFVAQYLSNQPTTAIVKVLNEMNQYGYFQKHEYEQIRNEHNAWDITTSDWIASVRQVLHRNALLHGNIIPILIQQDSFTQHLLSSDETTWTSWTLNKVSETVSSIPQFVSSFSSHEREVIVENICGMIDKQGHYVTNNENPMLLYWLKCMLDVYGWYIVDSYREVVNSIVKCAVATGLSEVKFEQLVNIERTFQAYYEVYCEYIFQKFNSNSCHSSRNPSKQVSLLPFVCNFNTNAKDALYRIFYSIQTFYSEFDITKSTYSNFYLLYMETLREKELFKALGHLVLKHSMDHLDKIKANGRLSAELYMHGIDTTYTNNAIFYIHSNFQNYHEYTINKWLHFALNAPIKDPLLILYWQMFFILYFASIGTKQFGHLILQLLKQPNNSFKKLCQERLRQLNVQYSKKTHPYSNDTSANSSKLVSTFRTLSSIYGAMEVWLDVKQEDLRMESHLMKLPAHYCAKHFIQVLESSDIFLHKSVTDTTFTILQLNMWWDLCLLSDSTFENERPDLDYIDVPTLHDQKATPNDFASTGTLFDKVHSPVKITNPIQWNALTMPLPKVTFNESLKIIEYSMPLQKQLFIDCAVQYSNTISTLISYDFELKTRLERLFETKDQVVEIVKPCNLKDECKRHATIRLEYSEQIKNVEIENSITTLHAQSAKLELKCVQRIHCYHLETQSADQAVDIATANDTAFNLDLSKLEVKVCYQILLIENIVSFILNQIKYSCADGMELKKWHQKGMDIFNLLIEMDSNQTRIFPPIQECLWNHLRALGSVCFDTNEINGLLRLMLQEPARICVLRDSFNPNLNPAFIVEYAANIINTYNSHKLSVQDCYTLISCFDFAAYFRHEKCTKFDRDTLVFLIVPEILALGQGIAMNTKGMDIVQSQCNEFKTEYRVVQSNSKGARNGEANIDVELYGQLQLINLYSKFLSDICVHHFVDHFESVLYALFGLMHKCQPKNTIVVAKSNMRKGIAAVFLWRAINDVPVSSWILLSQSQLKASVLFISEQISLFRWQHVQNSVATVVTAVQSSLQSANAGGETMNTNSFILLKWHREQTLQFMLQFILNCVQHLHSDQVKWRSISSVFTSLLQILFEPATQLTCDQYYPPFPEFHCLEIGEVVMNSLLPVCMQYIDWKFGDTSGDVENHQFSTREKLHSVWQLYSSVLIKNAPDYLCALYSTHLVKLNWSQYHLTEVTLNEMKIALSTANESSASNKSIMLRKPNSTKTKKGVHIMHFIRDILCKIEWNKGTLQYLESQTKAVCSCFLIKYVLMLVQCTLLHNDHTLTTSYQSFLNHKPLWCQRMTYSNAEMKAICNGTLGLLLNPLLFQSPSTSVEFQYTRTVTSLRIVVQGVQFMSLGSSKASNNELVLVGDEIKQTNIVLQFLNTLFHVNGSEFRREMEKIYGNIFESSLLTLLLAALQIMYELLSEILLCCDQYRETYHSEHIVTLYADIIRFLNLELLQNVQWNDKSLATRVSWLSLQQTITESTNAMVANCNPMQEIIYGAIDLKKYHEISVSLQKCVISFIEASKQESLFVLAICRSIASVSNMATLCEYAISNLVENNTSQSFDVVSNLMIPELSEEEFIIFCLRDGHIMTLTVRCMQIVDHARYENESVQLESLSRITNYVDVLIENDSVVKHELKFFFYLKRVVQYLAQDVFVCINMAFKCEIVTQMSKVLLKVGQQRVANGLMRVIGLGTGKLKYTPEFHVAVLVVAFYLRIQSLQSGSLRFNSKFDVQINPQTDDIGKALIQIEKESSCLHLGSSIDTLISFCCDMKNSLADCSIFFQVLCSELYPNEKWIIQSNL